MADVFLIRITENGVPCLEAKINVIDRELAQRNLMESLPGIVLNGAAAMVGVLLQAVSGVEPPQDIVGLAIDGNHTGLIISGQLPSSNGEGPLGPLSRRGH